MFRRYSVAFPTRCTPAPSQSLDGNRGRGYVPGQGHQACDISQKTSVPTPSVVYPLKALNETSILMGCATNQNHTDKSLMGARGGPFTKLLHTINSEIFMSEIWGVLMQKFYCIFGISGR